MTVGYYLHRRSLAWVLLALSIASLTFLSSAGRASAAPTGTNFDHIVIIAMENTAHASAFGSGAVSSWPTGSAPFLCSMLTLGSTLPSYKRHGATAAGTNDSNGCSV